MPKRDQPSLLWLSVFLIPLAMITAFVYAVLHDWIDPKFREMSGLIEALFSGLAFAGVLYSLYIQRWELRQTEKNLNDQIRMQVLIADLNALRHRIEILVFEMEMYSKTNINFDRESYFAKFSILSKELEERYNELSAHKNTVIEQLRISPPSGADPD